MTENSRLATDWSFQMRQYGGAVVGRPSLVASLVELPIQESGMWDHRHTPDQENLCPDEGRRPSWCLPYANTLGVSPDTRFTSKEGE